MDKEKEILEKIEEIEEKIQEVQEEIEEIKREEADGVTTHEAPEDEEE